MALKKLKKLASLKEHTSLEIEKYAAANLESLRRLADIVDKTAPMQRDHAHIMIPETSEISKHLDTLSRIGNVKFVKKGQYWVSKDPLTHRAAVTVSKMTSALHPELEVHVLPKKNTELQRSVFVNGLELNVGKRMLENASHTNGDIELAKKMTLMDLKKHREINSKAFVPQNQEIIKKIYGSGGFKGSPNASGSIKYIHWGHDSHAEKVNRFLYGEKNPFAFNRQTIKKIQSDHQKKAQSNMNRESLKRELYSNNKSFNSVDRYRKTVNSAGYTPRKSYAYARAAGLMYGN